MRLFAIAAIIASLMLPAYAESNPDKEQLNKAMEEKKKESAEIEKAYRDAAKRLPPPPAAKKPDPWSNLR